jgi:hypothetical protein
MYPPNRKKMLATQYVPGSEQILINARFLAVLFGGRTMRQVIERILRVFGKKENSDSTEEVLLDFLSKKSGPPLWQRSIS